MLKRIDDFWARVERAGIVGGFLVMSGVVFLDVVHRLAADRDWQTPGRIATLALATWALSHAAVRTATRGAMPHAKAAGVGAAITAGVLVGSFVFVRILPNGLIWAQTLALVLTIWVGFLGASLATKELKHLKVDAAERLFQGEARRWVSFTSDLVAGLFSGALAALALMYCEYNYQDWAESGGAAGMFEALPVPKFLAFGILPVTFATMSLRFLALAVQRARGVDPHPPPSPVSEEAGP